MYTCDDIMNYYYFLFLTLTAQYFDDANVCCVGKVLLDLINNNVLNTA